MVKQGLSDGQFRTKQHCRRCSKYSVKPIMIIILRLHVHIREHDEDCWMSLQSHAADDLATISM